jgi:hypothetical protein
LISLAFLVSPAEQAFALMRRVARCGGDIISNLSKWIFRTQSIVNCLPSRDIPAKAALASCDGREHKFPPDGCQTRHLISRLFSLLPPSVFNGSNQFWDAAFFALEIDVLPRKSL